MDIGQMNCITPSKSKVVKVGLLNKSLEGIDVNQRGIAHALASSFNIHHTTAKRLITYSAEGRSVTEMTSQSKRKEVNETEWPNIITEFCLTKPICREAPGETVSVGYGQRAEKYIRQFSVSEIYGFFMLKYPKFNYQLSTFRKLVPKNLVVPSLRDVKQNVCPLHENVKRSISAINSFFKKNSAKDLLLPSSTIDICLQIICSPSENPRNPLDWKPECTKHNCNDCGAMQWFNQLKQRVKDRDLGKESITYSQWVKEKDGEKAIKVLRKVKCNLDVFLDDVLQAALVDFPEHLRKAWSQWQVTKYPIEVVSNCQNDVAIRTREDFQENIKFLCMSETVSTHRGVGVITMVCYPIVIEVFKTDKTMEMYGLIIMSDSSSKNYDVVKYFEEKCLEYVRNLGFNIIRYDRITDGCSSQFWCYGSYSHLHDMPANQQIAVVNNHRTERYEGKSLSDALGSVLKRKMRSCALQNSSKVFGSQEEYMLRMLEEIDDNTDLDDLVFDDKMEAYLWLQACMQKRDGGNFSKKFKQIELMWIDEEEIPLNLVDGKVIRKIPKLKSYNLGTSIQGKEGVFMRDTSCVCQDCIRGNMLNCTVAKNGVYKKFDLQKKRRNKSKKAVVEEDSDEEEEEEFEYDSEIDDSSSGEDSDDPSNDEDLPMQCFLHTDELSLNQFVLYKWEDHTYYVGTVSDIVQQQQQRSEVTVSLMKKYFVRGKKLQFVWPPRAHTVVIDDLETSRCLRSLPDPSIDRRGTTEFNISVFGKVQLNNIS